MSWIKSTLCSLLLVLLPLQYTLVSEEELDPSFLETEGKELVKMANRWAKHRIEKLYEGSHIAETIYGPIEYVKVGIGPVVLCLHGGPGGYDQSLVIGSHLLEEGFSILAVSRPGYLRTPLSVGQTIQDQVEAMFALLDVLKIEHVAVLGYSTGAPIAFEMALQNPERVWGCVLESINVLPQYAASCLLVDHVIQYPKVMDVGSWLLYLGLRHRFRGTAEAILTLDTSVSEDGAYARFYHLMHSKSQRKFLKQLLDSMTPVEPRIEGLANDLNNLNDWTLYPYNQVMTPTIIVHAEDDRNGSYPVTKHISGYIAGAKLISVKGSGHFIWLGKHACSWQEDVAKFLRRAHKRKG